MSQVDKTRIIIQMHKGAIRLIEASKFNDEQSLSISMKMMEKICEEVIGKRETLTDLKDF